MAKMKILKMQCKLEHNEGRTIDFVISSEAQDRDGDVIEAAGWELGNFLKNPVVLFGHDHGGLPIGRASNMRVEGGNLKASVEFATMDQNPLAESVFRMVKDGFLKGASVGFMPIEFERDGDGMRFTKQELLEFSIVPIPSNPEALVASKSINLAPVREFLVESLEDWQNTKHTMFATRKQVDRVAKAIGKAIGKDAITFSEAHADGTPVAEKDEAWNGAEQVKEADIDDLKVMSTFVDDVPEDDLGKSSFKLPHHRARGGHAVVWRGVVAAMAALLGARGGVDIPDNDRRAVYTHLAKHYREFDEEPPEFRHVEDQTLKDNWLVLDKHGRVKLHIDLITEDLDEIKNLLKDANIDMTKKFDGLNKQFDEVLSDMNRPAARQVKVLKIVRTKPQA